MNPGSFCGSCGSVVKAGALYCGSCGAPTPGPAAATVVPVPPPTIIGTVGGSAPDAGRPPAPGQAPGPAAQQGAPAGPPGGTGYASFGRRAAAYVIDAIPYLILLAIGYSAAIAAILGRSTEGLSTSLIVLVAGPPVYFVGLWVMAAKGSSPGNAVLGIQVVREPTGAAPGAGLGLGRLLLKGLLIGITFYIGGFSPLWDRSGRRKGWWDSACGTVVLDRAAVGAYRAAAARTAPPSLPAMSLSPLPTPDLPADDHGWAAPPPGLDDRPAWDVPPGPGPARSAPAPVASWNDQPSRSDQSSGTDWPSWAEETTTGWSEPAVTATRFPGPDPLAPPAIRDAPDPDASRSAAAVPASVIRSVPGFATPDPAPIAAGPVPAPRPDRFDHTRMRVTPQSATAPGWRADLDDGRTLILEGPFILGRDPSAGPEETGTPVPVADEARSVSKTHLRLDVGPAGVQVTDRHSTNGVVVVTAGVDLPCVPGVPTPVPDGSTVRFGDRSLVVRST